MPGSPSASRYTYAGLFLVAASMIMYEILLTRIFSVTMWYHFAFVAISIAMFGMTVGALIVFLLPQVFRIETVKVQLAASAVAFAILTALSFLTQLSIPFLVHPSIIGLYAIALTYAVISVPFIAAGICICLALTRFPEKVSQLYAADLAAAGLGCVALIFVLQITDGPTAVFVIATAGSLGAWSFAADAGSRGLTRLAVVTTLLLGGFAAGHTVLVWREFPVLRILWAKGGFEARPLYETWNSYSRVRVSGNPDVPTPPYARSLSPAYPGDRLIRQLRMDIDVNASTQMIAYTGNDREVEHLRYDVTDGAYHIRKPRETLVIGTGGGRDLLAALAFGTPKVTGVELNGDIIRTANERFGDFTGHLDRHPSVAFVNDEARSYISRNPGQFDLIQISLIDTWAATAAGAFTLSENSLYTVEAWRTFLTHLTDRGILSVSRWHVEGRPDEIYRMVSLASAALVAAGVSTPADHIAVIGTRPTTLGTTETVGVGTMLVSRTPFSAEERARARETADTLQFDLMLEPGAPADPIMAKLLTPGQMAEVVASHPVDISAPTDNRPFFFNMLRLRHIWKADLLTAGKNQPNMAAVLVLGALLGTVIVLSAFCIVLPLLLTSREGVLRGAAPLIAYFACIGLAFMLIETSQMQRLIIVLGHPTYALSVVLFALLISSGLGSYWTRNIPAERVASDGLRRLTWLLLALIVFGVVTPMVTRSLESAETPFRIAAAVALLFFPGILMGMAFPIGIKLASNRSERLMPWLWGVNGAFSVCASVLSVVIALGAGISAAFWAGALAYAGALMTFRMAARST